MKRVLIPIIAVFIIAACKRTDFKDVENGVTLELADYRANSYKDVKYDLSFDIPKGVDEKIDAELSVEYNMVRKGDIILDFKSDSSSVKEVKCNNSTVEYRFVNNHIIIDEQYTTKGANSVNIKFIAGDMSLNRNKDYMYTLFVPDRASTAFPCFDQPDIKANFNLALNIPKNWKAVSNAPLDSVMDNGKKDIYYFKESRKMSTYLFSFVAGEFDTLNMRCGDRDVVLYHRVKDNDKLVSNVQEIGRLITESLNYVEDYTTVPYPFQKYDLVSIPSFQYGGMEHPGNIYYRESKIFLDNNATQKEEMARANLIAHETAHIWFGDLVTMKWFNEVWLKEVFANFIADKITRQAFPMVNFRLNFLLSHFPKSYSEDRTKGANPVTTPLDNLNNAGSVYGNIIYHKAPILMQQLEFLIGYDLFRDGVQEYVKQYSFGNATFNDLVKILDKRSLDNLVKWSDSWIYRAGMPEIEITTSQTDSVVNISLIGEYKKKHMWPQSMKFSFLNVNYPDTLVFFSGKEVSVPVKLSNCQVCLPNSDGIAYGYFKLDSCALTYLCANVYNTRDDLQRSVMWLDIWENYLNGNINNDMMMETFLNSLRTEKDPLMFANIAGYFKTYWWLFTENSERNNMSAHVENMLLDRIRTEEGKIRSSVYNLLVSVFTSDATWNRLHTVWKNESSLFDFKLSGSDLEKLSLQLALIKPERAGNILRVQKRRIDNIDKRRRYEFVSKALNSDKERRDEFFATFVNEENRAQEPWVQQAVSYLNHPYRSDEALERLPMALELLQEIQQTGDIFFPKGWLLSVYSGLWQQEAVDITERFLEANLDYPLHLKRKILQASDITERSAKIRHKF
ncbi:MAG: M1 family aminopeptidase [Bacteroidales bacterium]|jgi:aminopeptidase N|nr:M1 family aminopeptidase [Bacteroidales bacterium]